MNAAGRNATISLTTRDGNLRQNAVAGLVLFLQHWYWYPLLNFITLSMTPTALIGLSPNLKVPKSFKFMSQAKPSTFKYPEQWKKDDKATKEKVTTAVLSTTAKVKAREERKQKAEGGAANQDVEMSEQNTNKEEEKVPEEPKLTEEEQNKKDEEEKKQKLEAEPDFQELSNPSRVLKG